MTDAQLLSHWKPVLDQLVTKKYDRRQRPWTEAKKIFVAKSCQEIHEQITNGSANAFPLGQQTSNTQEIFANFIDERILWWDEPDSTEDDEKIFNKIYNEIINELKYANDKWGTEFDDKNTLNDWVTYITIYASDAAKMVTPPAEQRSKLLKAAGLAVSALSALERNGSFAERHYEDKVAK